MNSVIIRLVSANGSLLGSRTFVPTTSANKQTIVLAGSGGRLSPIPTSVPTISTLPNLSQYSNTEAMLANDATTYANAVNFVLTELQNYTPTANLTVATLNDVDDTTKSNNATLVFNTNNNKYTVKQLDLDGGNF
jgi:hypothetical protein